jgi:hypothetical protein
MASQSNFNLNRNDIIGSGNFGCVFGGTYNFYDVAIKRVSRFALNPDLEQIDECLEHVRRVNHPNVLLILDVFENDDFR